DTIILYYLFVLFSEMPNETKFNLILQGRIIIKKHFYCVKIIPGISCIKAAGISYSHSAWFFKRVLCGKFKIFGIKSVREYLYVIILYVSIPCNNILLNAPVCSQYLIRAAYNALFQFNVFKLMI